MKFRGKLMFGRFHVAGIDTSMYASIHTVLILKSRSLKLVCIDTKCYVSTHVAKFVKDVVIQEVMHRRILKESRKTKF